MRPSQGGRPQGISPQPAAPVRPQLLRGGQKPSPSGGCAGTFLGGDHPDVRSGQRQGTRAHPATDALNHLNKKPRNCDSVVILPRTAGLCIPFYMIPPEKATATRFFSALHANANRPAIPKICKPFFIPAPGRDVYKRQGSPGQR